VNNIKGRLTKVFHRKTKTGKAMTRAVLVDDTGSVEVMWFNQPYLKQVLFNGKNIIISGKAKYGYGKTSILNPTFEDLKQEQLHTGRIIPVYHQTEGITSKW